MTIAYYTAYLTVTQDGKALSEETLAEVGDLAWKLYEKGLNDEPIQDYSPGVPAGIV